MSRVVGGDPEPYFAVGWGIAEQRLRGFCVRHFGSFPCIRIFFYFFATFVAVLFNLTETRFVS